MSNANKAKGTRWETALVHFLRTVGIDAYRPAQAGLRDVGDLHGLTPFVGQAKDYKSWQDAIREGLDGAEKQKHNAGQPYGVAFIKRIRRDVRQGYAVTTVATFAHVLVRLRRAEKLLATYAAQHEVEEHFRSVSTECGDIFDGRTT
ncbi:hypothetical protein [Krasilnikovia sp. MM14-A1259]|uniref:hypothetical protein n=1 Tax=Krasilnikovia sp. MM14-A1259 TaxID=3373539 RepID=UPI0037F7D60D